MTKGGPVGVEPAVGAPRLPSLEHLGEVELLAPVGDVDDLGGRPGGQAVLERGEVGGQTAAEIFQMANQFLMDAIALDSSLTDLDNVWMTV